MNYSFYLFTKLFDEIMEINYHYDYKTFKMLEELYNIYESSEYNKKEIAEHENMINFIKNKMKYNSIEEITNQ